MNVCMYECICTCLFRKPWYVLSCLKDGTYNRSLAAKQSERIAHIVVAAGSSLYHMSNTI